MASGGREGPQIELGPRVPGILHVDIGDREVVRVRRIRGRPESRHDPGVGASPDQRPDRSPRQPEGAGRRRDRRCPRSLGADLVGPTAEPVEAPCSALGLRSGAPEPRAGKAARQPVELVLGRRLSVSREVDHVHHRENRGRNAPVDPRLRDEVALVKEIDGERSRPGRRIQRWLVASREVGRRGRSGRPRRVGHRGGVHRSRTAARGDGWWSAPDGRAGARRGRLRSRASGRSSAAPPIANAMTTVVRPRPTGMWRGRRSIVREESVMAMDAVARVFAKF
jgi:hypothetical protein